MMKSMKVVEIDDAGWGDLLGGVFITVMRMDTYEHVSSEISVIYFQGNTMFHKKVYLEQCAQIVHDALMELDIDPDEFELHICQGYVFSRAEEELARQGWEIKRRRISGTVQQVVEHEYRQSIIDLGFSSFLPIQQRMYERKRSDRSRELISRGKFRFYQMIDWIQEDPEDRVRFVKTGWRSWSYWKHRVFSQAELREKYKEMRYRKNK